MATNYKNSKQTHLFWVFLTLAPSFFLAGCFLAGVVELGLAGDVVVEEVAVAAEDDVPA